jgi:hypothetical protein
VSADRKPTTSDLVLSNVDLQAEPADREEVLNVGRWISHGGDPGAWSDGTRLERLVPVAEAARSLDRTEREVRQAVEQNQLLAVEESPGEPLVAAFQLARDIDAIGPVIAAVVACLKPVCTANRTIWLWFLAPKDELEGQTPAHWLTEGGNPSPVLVAAERDAQRLGN